MDSENSNPIETTSDYNFDKADLIVAKEYADKYAPKDNETVSIGGRNIEVVNEQFRWHLNIRAAFLNGIRFERERNK